MMKTRCQFVSSLFCLTGLVLIISILGCNSSDRVPPKGLPKLYPCFITLTQEGEPLVGAMVKLHSQGESIQWMVSGKTDDRGMVLIFTDGYFKGAPAGEYKVTVEKYETVAPPLPDVLPTNEAALQRLYNKQETDARDYRLVEPIYGKADSTPLSITVEKKKTETSLDVGKKYRELAQ